MAAVVLNQSTADSNNTDDMAGEKKDKKETHRLYNIVTKLTWLRRRELS